jgi:hypothetical protein
LARLQAKPFESLMPHMPRTAAFAAVDIESVSFNRAQPRGFQFRRCFIPEPVFGYSIQASFGQRFEHRVGHVLVKLDIDLRPEFVRQIIELPASNNWHQ